MKALLPFLLLVLLGSPSLGQEQALPQLSPKMGRSLDFGPEAQQEWKKNEAMMTALNKGDKSWDDLNQEDMRLLEKFGETRSSLYEAVGEECSWYCGGSVNQIVASSFLADQGKNSYSPVNAHDLSFETAWVEGVAGHGIGEYLRYTFKPETPRITEIKIANGYVKSPAAWKANSRVKKLKVLVNNKPYAILLLEDSMQEQIFEVEPIGYGDRKNFLLLKRRPAHTITFEIMEVYPGSKYQDTVISEIFFEGIDVH